MSDRTLERVCAVLFAIVDDGERVGTVRRVAHGWVASVNGLRHGPACETPAEAFRCTASHITVERTEAGSLLATLLSPSGKRLEVAEADNPIDLQALVDEVWGETGGSISDLLFGSKAVLTQRVAAVVPTKVRA